MSVCPTGAISRDAELSMVVVDGQNCITCAMCAMVCPFDVLTFYPSPAVRLDKAAYATKAAHATKAVAIKCDHCIDRQRQDQVPTCVEACKVGSLVFGDINELVKDASLSLARTVSLAVSEMQPEMARLPANVEAWRELGQSTTEIGRE
jgi:carbon-monoxide dehydrogenase iron sulfur subunit